jgi:transposase
MGQQPYFSTVERLDAILASLPDDVLSELQAPTGRPGYGPKILFRAYIATFILNSSSISAALREIADSPQLAKAVGGAPTKYALSRFISKLKDTDILQRLMAVVADSMRELLPKLGEYAALDSTDIKAWARRHSNSDPDAGTSVKKMSNGFKQFWYGYKTHLYLS